MCQVKRFRMARKNLFARSLTTETRVSHVNQGMSDLAQQAPGKKKWVGWLRSLLYRPLHGMQELTSAVPCLSDVRLFESIMGVVNPWNHH